MAALALGLAYAGFLLLSLAMDRHHRELLGGAPPRVRRLACRLGGAASLGLSILPCFALWGWSIGPVAWCGVLTLAAFGLVALLAFAPRAALLLAPLLPAVGFTAWFGLD
ncbi:DUF3325 domain-containing protein [Siccirubricoccus sp. KC 17139]|uniref:DUF3325 domain-containing protein n=1 Tax=Siccirubricoccus soli TaxID=2899147 RepID=A0ABT1D759_9PROT|nr:DUF3325 domain-containing protein [Siccirubricoccus soli]MCO6417753.1 DUF3325 domain-containing protein [Siccirubricoccus soli]MCP2683888.1 DUF3325 domain-containing protein [Siccirubricoccus soli]